MMEQLSFDIIYTNIKLKTGLCDWREVKIKGKNILLSDWEPVKHCSNWVRRICPDDKFSIIGLMVSWDHPLPSARYCWAPMFLGPDLHDLDKIYNEFYPKDKPHYWDDQLEEAKKHLDDFIARVNSLKIFL